jgi:hypothetical protein
VKVSLLGVIACITKFKSIPGSTTDLGQSQTDSPDLTLVAQAILSDELQLRVTVVYLSV